VTAETTFSASLGDPAAMGARPVSNPNGNPISGEVSLATPGDGVHVPRRVKRITETQEIQIRTTHRRRKVLTRGGVLAGFGLAMVVYPVMGNVVTYENALENVPGVVVGEAPTTGLALLGDGPALIASNLPLPSIDEQAHFMATSEKYTVSAALPGCLPHSEYPGENGKLDSSLLCTLWDGNVLRSDAALAFAQLNEQFKAYFGRNICIYEGYRSYEDQVATKRSRGYLAARPGKSVHGWGLAFDLCDGDDRGSPKAWLDANAATYGFENPDWAKWRKYEPWHWEYMPGTQALGVYGAEYWEADGGNTTDATTDTTTDSTTGTGGTNPVVTPTPTPGAAG
jgi:D-alanyl-D-alanine carboxypeptidase